MTFSEYMSFKDETKLEMPIEIKLLLPYDYTQSLRSFA